MQGMQQQHLSSTVRIVLDPVLAEPLWLSSHSSFSIVCQYHLSHQTSSSAAALPMHCKCVQVELVVDDMRRSLARRAGVDRRLPTFVGMSGFQDYAINIVVLVSLGLCMALHNIPSMSLSQQLRRAFSCYLFTIARLLQSIIYCFSKFLEHFL